jgi:hypothetical protein
MRLCRRSALTATVIICHSLGETSDGFFEVAKRLLAAVPYSKFVLPTDPTKKVTKNRGMEIPLWYGIVGLDRRSNGMYGH